MVSGMVLWVGEDFRAGCPRARIGNQSAASCNTQIAGLRVFSEGKIAEMAINPPNLHRISPTGGPATGKESESIIF
jgi:hypothetical protein